jgi:uncharacterized membrane protein YcaP (DUF421 family)
MLLWLATEVVQVIYILRLNAKLFPKEALISMTPVVHLAFVLTGSLALAAWPAYHNVQWPLFEVAAVAIGFTGVLCVFCYFTFKLGEVRKVLEGRLRRRFAVLR